MSWHTHEYAQGPTRRTWAQLFRQVIVPRLGVGSKLYAFVTNLDVPSALRVIREFHQAPTNTENWALPHKQAAMMYVDNACTNDGHRGLVMVTNGQRARPRVLSRCDPLTIERYELYLRLAMQHMTGAATLYVVDDAWNMERYERDDIDFSEEPRGAHGDWVGVLRPPLVAPVEREFRCASTPPAERRRQRYQRRVCSYL